MPYSNRIKTLEESLRLVESQISLVEKSDIVDQDQLKKFQEARNRYLVDLRDMRRAQYEASQVVDFGDDR